MIEKENTKTNCEKKNYMKFHKISNAIGNNDK